MEPRLRALGIDLDLDAVRLHHDAWSDAICTELSARALTVGNHLAFREGAFAPASPAGLTLLLHELTHVWQQGTRPMASGLVTDGALEVEADAIAGQASATSSGGATSLDADTCQAPGPRPADTQRPPSRRGPPAGAVAVQLYHEGSGRRFHPYLVSGNTPEAQGRDALAAGRQIARAAGEELRDIRVVGTDTMTVLASNGSILATVRLTGRPPRLPPGIYTALRDAEAGVVARRWGTRVDRGGSMGYEVHASGSGLANEHGWADLASARGLAGTGFTVWVYPGVGAESRDARLPDVPATRDGVASTDEAAASEEPTARGPRRSRDGSDAPGPASVAGASGSATSGRGRVTAGAERRGSRATSTERDGADSGSETGRGQLDAPLPSHIEGPDRVRGGHDAEFRDMIEGLGGTDGADTLRQVDEYDRHGSYRWELFDLTEEARLPEADRATRIRALERGERDGRNVTDGDAVRNEWRNTRGDLGEDARSAAAGLERAGLVNRLANVLNVLTTPVDAAIASGRTVGHLAAVVIAGSANRRFVPFPARDGVFAVRCTAVPRDRNGRQLRGASIAVRVVQVTSTAVAVDRSLDEASRREGDRQGRVSESIAGERTELRTRIRTLESQPASAARDRQLDALRARDTELERAIGVATQHERDFGQARQFRPHAVYVDDARGQSVALRLVIGAPTGAASARRSHLVDLTIPETAEALDGEGSDPNTAVWAAIESFARQGRYGRGTLGVRLPADMRGVGVTELERRIRTFPQDGARAEATLTRALEIAGYAAMAAGGTVGVVAGAAVAAAGAVMSAHRLWGRNRNHTLRAADPETIADIANILVGVASGASTLGRLTVERSSGGFRLIEREAISAGTRTASTVEAGANQVALISGEATAITTIQRINEREARGDITREQADEQRRDAVAHLIQQGVLHVDAVRGHIDGAGRGATNDAEPHATVEPRTEPHGERAPEGGGPSGPAAPARRAGESPAVLSHERATTLAGEGEGASTHVYDRDTYAALYRDSGGEGPVPPFGFVGRDGRPILYTPAGSLQPRGTRDAGMTPASRPPGRSASEQRGATTDSGARDTTPDAQPWGATAGRDSDSGAGGDRRTPAYGESHEPGRDTTPDRPARETPAPGEDFGNDTHRDGRDTYSGERRSRHPEGPEVEPSRAPGERDTVEAMITDAPGGPSARSPEEARRGAPAALREALAAGEVPAGQRFHTRERANALDMYRTLAEVSPGREVAIFRNLRTGDYFVVQGGPSSVRLDSRAMAAELGIPYVPTEWLTRRHIHPPDSTGRVGAERRVPSGLDGDMRLAVNDSAATGRAVTEVVDFPTSRGYGRIEYGFDPNAASPYFYRRYEPGDSGNHHLVAERRFRSAEAYHEYLDGFSRSADIPDGYSGRLPAEWQRRRNAAGAAPEGGAVHSNDAVPASGSAHDGRASAVPERAGHQGAPLRRPGESSGEPRTRTNEHDTPAVRSAVGPDGVVPTGAHLRASSEAEAIDTYRCLAERSPEREVIVVQDTVTGRFVVVQGGRASSHANEAWLASETGRPFNRSEWRAIRHSHPAEHGETPEQNHGPSPGDIRQLLLESAATGQAARSQIDFRTESGWGHTEYGYDPSRANPYWVRVHRPGEAPLSGEFSEYVGYSRWARTHLHTEGDNQNFNPEDLRGRHPPLWTNATRRGQQGPEAPQPLRPNESAPRAGTPEGGEIASPLEGAAGQTPARERAAEARRDASAERRNDRNATEAAERARVRAYGEARIAALSAQVTENQAESAQIQRRIAEINSELVRLARSVGMSPDAGTFTYLADRHRDPNVRARARALLDELAGTDELDGLRPRAEQNRGQNRELQRQISTTPLPDEAAAVYERLRAAAGRQAEAAAMRAQPQDAFGNPATAADDMTAEHVCPLIEIVYAPGFTSIRDERRQLAIINHASNLVPLLRSVNSRRSDRPWREAAQWMALPRDPAQRQAVLRRADELARAQESFEAGLAARIEAALAAER